MTVTVTDSHEIKVHNEIEPTNMGSRLGSLALRIFKKYKIIRVAYMPQDSTYRQKMALSRPYQKMLWGGASSEGVRLEPIGEGTPPMHQETFELNCSRTPLALDSTMDVVVEMSLSTW